MNKFEKTTEELEIIDYELPKEIEEAIKEALILASKELANKE